MPRAFSSMRAAFCLFAYAQVCDAAPSMDASFGNGGFVTVNTGAASAELGAALQQSDGKIVIVGNAPALPHGFSALPVASADFLIARFNAEGTPDASFGSAGVVRIDFDGGEDAARAVAQQPDGKLVIAGWATRGNDVDFAVIRLLPDGTLDSSFSEDGRQLVNLPFKLPSFCEQPPLSPCVTPNIDVELAQNRAKALALLEDGGLVVSGETIALGAKGLAFVRLSAAGQLDATFGAAHDGRFTMYFPFLDYRWNVAPSLVRSRGEALSATGAGSVPSIVGMVDLTLPSGTFNILDPTNAVPEILFQLPDGRVLIAGSVVQMAPGLPARFRTWLSRLDKDLRTDTSFGANGVFMTADPSGDDAVLGLALESGGKILSAGYSMADRADPAAGVRATLRRFLDNGLPDPNFASGGVLQLDLSGGSAGLASRLQAVMTTADGKIVVAGTRGRADPSLSRRFFDPTSAGIVVARIDNTPTFEMRDDTRHITEGTTSPTIEVSRLGETTGSVSVRYLVTAGTASIGADFVAASGTLTWNPGDAASRSIPIQLVNDSSVETAETLLVELSEPSEGMVSRKRTTVTIVDDDVAAPPVAPPSVPSAPPTASGGGGSIDLFVVSLLALVFALVRRSRSRRVI